MVVGVVIAEVIVWLVCFLAKGRKLDFPVMVSHSELSTTSAVVDSFSSQRSDGRRWRIFSSLN
jgi:hypothetical protein